MPSVISNELAIFEVQFQHTLFEKGYMFVCSHEELAVFCEENDLNGAVVWAIAQCDEMEQEAQVP
jgi:hypothetical protein